MHSSQFIGNNFVKSLHDMFSENRNFARNLIFLYMASETEQFKNRIHSLAT